MNDSPKKSLAFLLAEARTIASFSGQDWPKEFSPNQIAALMAGGWKGEHLARYKIWKSLVHDAIKAGTLIVRSEPRAPITTTLDADGISDHQRFRKNLVRDGKGFDGRLVYTVTKTPPAKLWVGRHECTAWLVTTNEQPGEHIKEWLRKRKENLTERRIAQILSVIKANGHDVMSIPDGGKASAKSRCLESFPQLFTDATFDKAWGEASLTTRLAMAKKDVYSRKP